MLLYHRRRRLIFPDLAEVLLQREGTIQVREVAHVIAMPCSHHMNTATH
jgi:hypothetical protein